MVEPSQNTEHSSAHWIRFRAWLLRFCRVLARFWWVVFFTTAAGLAVAAWFIFQEQPVFVSTGRMMVSGKINIQEGAVYSEELLNFFGTQIELMKSAEVRNRAADRLAAIEPQLRPVPVALAVSQLPQTSIFVFSATGPEPQYPQKLLDTIMSEYIATKKEIRSAKSENAQTAIMEEISRVEHEMKVEEGDLLAWQKQNNAGYLEQEGNSAASYLAKLNREVADLKTQYQLFDSLDIDQIIEKVQNDPTQAGAFAARTTDQDGLLSNMSEPQVQYLQAKQQMAVLKAERDEYSKVLRPKHPQMVDLDRKVSEQETLIASLRKQSMDELKSKRDSLKLQIENLGSVIKEWEAKALSLSQRLAEYNQLRGNLDRSKSLYDRLVNSLHDVDVTRNVDQDLVSILEKATPAQMIKPWFVPALVFGTGIGLLIGLTILFLTDRVDDRVSSMADLPASRLDAHVLAQIPTERNQGMPMSLVTKDSVHALPPDDSRHAFAEALRSLRSSLLYLPVEGERPRTILITSAQPREGKSTIASNLAITMALANLRVLLVDADLRCGTLHTWFGRDRGPGLSNLLSGTEVLDNCVSPTLIHNLDLITRGVSPPNPGELFLSARFDQFLRDVYGSYDIIIFDSSPLMASDDTTTLAPKIDAAIFAVRFCHSSARISRKGLELLRARQANVIGIVCNDVSRTDQEFYYYRYPEYYSPIAES
jgi:polysaccharide biosynthesis transport protein